MDTIQDKHVKNPRHNSPPMILIGNQMVYTSELTRVLSKPRTAAVTKYSRGHTYGRQQDCMIGWSACAEDRQKLWPFQRFVRK